MAAFEGTKFQESRFVLDTNTLTHAQSPNWSSLASAANLSDHDISSLRAVEEQSSQATTELLESGNNATDLGEALLKVVSSVSDAGALNYVVQLTEEVLLTDLSKRVDMIFGHAAHPTDLLTTTPESTPSQHPAVIAASSYAKLLEHSDEMVRLRSRYVSAMLLSVGGAKAGESSAGKTVLNSLCDEITAEFRVETFGLQAGLQTLSVLLRNYSLRSAFDNRAGVLMLLDLADRAFPKLVANSQYSLALCIWLSCFSESAASRVDQAGLSTMVRLLRSEPRLPTTRLLLAAIRIVLSADPAQQQALCEAVIEAKLPKILTQLANKKNVTDIEMRDNLKWLRDTLSRNFKVLSTFERHAQELRSKKLTKSMLHEDLFWKENALKFEHNNFSSIKQLIDLLASEDPETVAIACSDIGFFVQYFPNGKAIVEKEGGKQAIMSLLNHENPDVQKQALVACSKIMITNWESVKSS